MSLAKTKLKAARDAIGKKDFEKARDAATSVLDYEPDNYNGHVFLALAQSELGQLDASEQSYRNAIQLNKDQLLAWQGLSKLYEKSGKLDRYCDTLLELMNLFSANDDAIKCAETYQKLLEHRRKGTRKEIVETLGLVLPESRFYSTLSQLPVPDHTNPSATTTFQTQVAIHDSLPVILEIVDLTEQDEKEYIKKEVERRRTRLGAPPVAQLQRDVGLEMWSLSRLPSLYNEILNHPNTSDDLRRDVDSRLLRYKQQHLFALPTNSEQKAQLAQELESLASGAVLLRIPDELAWLLILEVKDASTIEKFELGFLRQLMTTFPNRPIAKLIKGYFAYSGLLEPEPKEKGEGEDEGEDEESEPENEEQEIPLDEAYDMMIDAFSDLGHSIFAHLVLASVYLEEQDYTNAIKTVNNGLELLKISEQEWGRKREWTRLGLKVILATSLVHLYPPKHHVRALPIIDEILAQDPDNVPALMGRGYILQARESWEPAAQLFEKAHSLADEHDMEGLRAWEEGAWCRSREDKETGVEDLKGVLDAWDSVGSREEDSARCLWRIGSCYFDLQDDRNQESYKYFIQSLKRNSTYAPAFTSLGIYYSASSPPDLTRASKCFQKAFELDARETEAAKRLAEGFAEEREWDLVEVVARRTIDGEGGLEAGLGQTQNKGSRFLTTNAWAWKAVGVVELVHRNYPQAIQSLQIALRATPDDALLWLRLGEAYNSAGRQVAATKALERAKELGINDWMCSYFLGDVRRQLGQFGEAITTFKDILANRPNEIGVLVSLGQTYVDQGHEEARSGFITRAETSLVAAVRISLQIVDHHPGFRSLAWKVVADSLYTLSSRTSFIHYEEVVACLHDVVAHVSKLPDDLAAVVPADPMVRETIGGLQALEIAIFAYHTRLSVNSAQVDCRGSPDYDLGVSLLAWASKATTDEAQQKKARDKGAQFIVRALKEDPANDLYWVALGTAKFLTQPKTAQHAYLKALDVDSKNVSTWSTLGFLYLFHNDIELATEAFIRAQAVDPDAPVAWIGQALIASSQGLKVETMSLLQHATSLSANLPDADLEFSSLSFSSHLGRSSSNKKTDLDLLPAFFALNRYCKQRPDDPTGLHLLSLVCESLGQVGYAEELASRSIAILEASYEETEDPAIEKHFTISTANAARLKLSLGDFEGALEGFESVLGLLGDDEDIPTDANHVVLKVQAQFLSGIAHFKLGQIAEALQFLESAVQSGASRTGLVRQISVVLAQVLWADGTPEAQEAAKNRLLECISEDAQNLSAITALAAMGILSEDESLIDAALSEILSLPAEERRQLDPQGDVRFLLVRHHLGQGEVKKALSIAQSAVFVDPAGAEVRTELSTLLMQQGEHESALAILSSDERADTENARGRAKTIALTSAAKKIGSKSDKDSLLLAQRAVFLSPSDSQSWAAIALAKAGA